jgi:hypothetical protein
MSISMERVFSFPTKTQYELDIFQYFEPDVAISVFLNSFP